MKKIAWNFSSVLSFFIIEYKKNMCILHRKYSVLQRKKKNVTIKMTEILEG